MTQEEEVSVCQLAQVAGDRRDVCIRQVRDPSPLCGCDGGLFEAVRGPILEPGSVSVCTDEGGCAHSAVGDALFECLVVGAERSAVAANTASLSVEEFLAREGLGRQLSVTLCQAVCLGGGLSDAMKVPSSSPISEVGHFAMMLVKPV